MARQVSIANQTDPAFYQLQAVYHGKVICAAFDPHD
jgi:hypothetical protein